MGHDAHLLYTLSALQILALLDRLELLGDTAGLVAQYVSQLQQPDGSFAGDQWGKRTRRVRVSVLCGNKHAAGCITTASLL